MISYRLRSRDSPIPLPAAEADLGLEQIESQCSARCLEGGPLAHIQHPGVLQGFVCHGSSLLSVYTSNTALISSQFGIHPCRPELDEVDKSKTAHHTLPTRRPRQAHWLSRPFCVSAEVRRITVENDLRQWNKGEGRCHPCL